MDYKTADADELKHKFWKAFADSPFVFLERKNNPDGAVVMTAQLDKDANSAIWFFTKRDHHLAKMGPALCTFAGDDNQIFARFDGTLSEESDKSRIDQFWNNIVEAWFEGKDDPNMILLRMDLGNAEIWNSDLGMISNAKMLLGMDVREESREKHVESTPL